MLYIPKYRGVKIKPKDVNLCRNTLLLVFFLFFLLFFGIFFLARLPAEFTGQGLIDYVKSSYFITAVLVSAFLSGLLLWLGFSFFQLPYERLFHRQQLAQMMVSKGWVTYGQSNNSGFWKDLPSSNKKTIEHYPKIRYKLKNGMITLSVENYAGNIQDQLLNCDKNVETSCYCELIDRIQEPRYIVFNFLYDMRENRISIDDVYAKDGKLRLMKNVWWSYDDLPHMLIAGGTGGGKTYFLLTLIETLLHTNCNMFILDPKNADLADLGDVLPNVYYKKDDMIQCLDAFYFKMMERSEQIKNLDNYVTGKNYAYYGLEANFLIFDEYTAFIESLPYKEREDVLSRLKQIIFLGRQAGFFLILACQRPDVKYLADGIRDQFNFRVALGRMSEMGYSMMFGETRKVFFYKPIKGRGYVDSGTGVISEFYTPIVPKKHDFLGAIRTLYATSADDEADERGGAGSARTHNHADEGGA